MERARILLEIGKDVYFIGPGKSALAMRRAGDPHLRTLAPFASLADARRVCEGLGLAQIVRFPSNGHLAVESTRSLRRSGMRRRKPGQAHGSEPRAVTPVPAAAQVISPAPASPTSTITAPAAAKPSNRPASLGTSAKHRPSPETVARLDEAIEHITAPFR